MQYTITWARSAVKALRGIERENARRILRAVDALSHDPRPPGYKQLKGGSGELRIRIGDYRVIYDVSDKEVLILVLRVGHRGDVYK